MPTKAGRDVARASALLLFALCAGCGPRNTYVPPPPPEVIVGVPEQRSVTVYHEYTGTTEASESVDLRARVQGYLDSIHFQDGSMVSQGQLLFVVDQRPYVASLDQAKAELEAKQATAVQQESIYKRALSLVPARAVSQEEVDVDRGNWLAAQAAVVQAQAALRQAQLNLEYTEIRAPVAGRIGRRMIDVGNLVSANTTLLAAITKYDPMYVYFDVSESNYLDYLHRLRERQQEASGKKPPPPASQKTAGTLSGVRTPIEMGLGNEPDYPHQGYIDFSSPTVDPNTGTLLLRGVFANPAPYYLAPGLFARVRVPADTEPDAILVPDSALGTDQAGRYVLVVRQNNVVERRTVTVGTLSGGLRVIDEGLKPGERFVVEGLQKARPGAKVRPIMQGTQNQGPASPVQGPTTSQPTGANSQTPSAKTQAPGSVEPSPGARR